MRGKTRSQRIKDYRKARFDRAIRVIEGKNFHRNNCIIRNIGYFTGNEFFFYEI